jgi:hypothetical protein
MTDQQPPTPDQLATQRTHYQLAHKFIDMLPPPLDKTPDARAARDQAAIAEAAAMLPVGDEEMKLAVHCVAARARAEEALCTIARAGTYDWVIKMERQFALMERTANANRSLLLKLQAQRRKRARDADAVEADEWAAHIAGQCISLALQQKAAPGAGGETPVPAPAVASPAQPPVQSTEDAAAGREAAEAALQAIVQRARETRRRGMLVPLEDAAPSDAAPVRLRPRYDATPSDEAEALLAEAAD